MRDFYILADQHRPISEPDLMEWAKWMAEHEAEHTLALTEIGDVRISTIFLGVACWPTELHPDSPILWETMVFGGLHDRDVVRYASHDEAIAGHAAVVAMVRGGGAPNDP